MSTGQNGKNQMRQSRRTAYQDSFVHICQNQDFNAHSVECNAKSKKIESNLFVFLKLRTIKKDSVVLFWGEHNQFFEACSCATKKWHQLLGSLKIYTPTLVYTPNRIICCSHLNQVSFNSFNNSLCFRRNRNESTAIFSLGQCLFCHMRQKHRWNYFAFSQTRLVEVITWRVQNALPA